MKSFSLWIDSTKISDQSRDQPQSHGQPTSLHYGTTFSTNYPSIIILFNRFILNYIKINNLYKIVFYTHLTLSSSDQKSDFILGQVESISESHNEPGPKQII